MDKTVGKFRGTVSDPAPCWCSIASDDQPGRSITFDHRDLADLEHLVSEMKKAARRKLPDFYKDEV